METKCFSLITKGVNSVSARSTFLWTTQTWREKTNPLYHSKVFSRLWGGSLFIKGSAVCDLDVNYFPGVNYYLGVNYYPGILAFLHPCCTFLGKGISGMNPWGKCPAGRRWLFPPQTSGHRAESPAPPHHPSASQPLCPQSAE